MALTLMKVYYLSIILAHRWETISLAIPGYIHTQELSTRGWVSRGWVVRLP